MYLGVLKGSCAMHVMSRVHAPVRFNTAGRRAASTAMSDNQRMRIEDGTLLRKWAWRPTPRRRYNKHEVNDLQTAEMPIRVGTRIR